MQTSELTFDGAKRALESALQVADLILAARIQSGARATDFVVQSSPTDLSVIRCVERIGASDHTALATMLSEGTFVWAALVYEDRERSETTGLIETFHVSELDRLVSRLSELREAFSEAR